MSMVNNKPFDDINKMVREDLSKYGQDNPCPLSITIRKNGKSFRHYELGPIMGYVLFGDFDQESGFLRTFISEIHEDDEYWFAPSAPMYMSGAWIKASYKTYTRMKEWYDEHIFEGFIDGEWVSKFVKPIKYEIVYRADGMAANPVLGGIEE